MHSSGGGPKVTKGPPHFRYIGACGPHIYLKIRARGGGGAFKGTPIYYDTGPIMTNRLASKLM